MKKLIFAAAMFIFSATCFAQSGTYVNGYTKSNGTYVSGYYKTTPDYTRDNNYSTKGNVNPYTGASGTKQGGLNSSYYTPSYSNPISMPVFSSPLSSNFFYSTPSVYKSNSNYIKF